jgi:hypothetical protein
MTLSRGLLALCLVIPLALTACGDNPRPGTRGPTGGPVGAGNTERLVAEVGADHAPLLATSGHDALVLAVSEQGTLHSHLSTDGELFESGEPLETGLGYVQLGDVVALPDGSWFALGSGGTVERDGDTELTFDPVAFRSTDGLSWEQVDVDGFAHPVDVNDLEVVGGTVVMAGAYRTAGDPGMGGFEAHVWTSTDAASFDQLELPGVLPPRGYRNESYAGHLVVTGDRLLVAGRVDASAAVWASDDEARTWQQVADPALDDVYDISGLAAVGDVVLAGVGDGSTAALRSTDRGATWAPVDALPVTGEDIGWAPVWADEDRFWTLTGIDDTSWIRPEVCYADLDQCGQDPAPRLVTSADGSDWTAVDLLVEPEIITGTSDGRALILGVDGDGVVVHTVAAGAAPPAAPATPEPKTVELVTLDEGEAPQTGVRYHAPMYVHCGMDWFWFGDDTWVRTDNGPDVETGAGEVPPEGWPLVGQVLYGYATLKDADHLEYSFDEEVIATYRRADGAPGCD